MPLIKLQSNDGETFSVDVDVAKKCVTIKDMLDALDKTGEESVVPLPNVSGRILAKVVEWSIHHKDDPEGVPEADEGAERRTDDLPPWDVEFLKVDQATLFELILAANYLDIKGLLEICCKTVAGMIKGQGPDEIRKTFNIGNDFTPEEEEQVKKENEWCQEP